MHGFLAEPPPVVFSLFVRLLSPSEWHFRADEVKTKHEVCNYEDKWEK